MSVILLHLNSKCNEDTPNNQTWTVSLRVTSTHTSLTSHAPWRWCDKNVGQWNCCLNMWILLIITIKGASVFSQIHLVLTHCFCRHIYTTTFIIMLFYYSPWDLFWDIYLLVYFPLWVHMLGRHNNYYKCNPRLGFYRCNGGRLLLLPALSLIVNVWYHIFFVRQSVWLWLSKSVHIHIVLKMNAMSLCPQHKMTQGH